MDYWEIDLVGLAKYSLLFLVVFFLSWNGGVTTVDIEVAAMMAALATLGAYVGLTYKKKP